MMRERKGILAAAVCLFAISGGITLFAVSGMNIYQVPVINNIAEAFYETSEVEAEKRLAAGEVEAGEGLAASEVEAEKRLAAGEVEAGEVEAEKRPVVVIDAGHGGMDGGASSADGVSEKDLTLSIAKKLEEEISRFDVTVVMTRAGDEGLYVDDERTIRQKKREDLMRRKEIIEGLDTDIAVSIHLNSFPQDVSVYGAQVFYPKHQNERTGVRDDEHTSKEFAEAVQKSLELRVSDGRERIAMAKNDILMFKDTTATIILVECGFLSNPNESKLLQTAEYQHLLSQAIWEGINEILCVEKTEKIQVIDSANNNA